jgi:hypothetical protein
MFQVTRRVTASGSEKIRQNERKLLYSFFWVIPRRLNLMCQRFGTLCLFHLHRSCEIFLFSRPMKMEQTECSETSTHNIQTPGNHPEERIRHSEQGESLKLRMNENYYEYNYNWKCLYQCHR